MPLGALNAPIVVVEYPGVSEVAAWTITGMPTATAVARPTVTALNLAPSRLRFRMAAHFRPSPTVSHAGAPGNDVVEVFALAKERPDAPWFRDGVATSRRGANHVPGRSRLSRGTRHCPR